MKYAIYKLNEQGKIAWQYEGQLVQQETNFICLEAQFNRADMDLGYAVFQQGDRFVEYFYSDRWYNVFAVYSQQDGRLKGWYCNISRPARIGATAVHYEDLALDLWVSSQWEAQVLDEDEFEALELAETDRLKSRHALQELLALIESRQLPS